MMGIVIKTSSTMLIDNQSVVMNTQLPSSTIKKKWLSIAYHRIREAIAAGIIRVAHIRSTANIADVLTKPLGPADYWRLLTEVLYGRQSQDRGTKGELQESTRSKPSGPTRSNGSASSHWI